MSSDDSHEDLQQHVEETLGDHRNLLERLAELDTGLSDDAARAIEILDAREEEDQS